jgi:hypothetical protein
MSSPAKSLDGQSVLQNLISFLFLAIPSLISLSWFYGNNAHARGLDTKNLGYRFDICSHIINSPLPSHINHNIPLVESTLFHCFHRKLHFGLKMLVSHPWNLRMLFHSEHTHLFTPECGIFLNIDKVFYVNISEAWICFDLLWKYLMWLNLIALSWLS